MRSIILCVLLLAATNQPNRDWFFAKSDAPYPCADEETIAVDGGCVARPTLLRKAAPEYPKKGKKLKLEARAIFLVVVNADGTVAFDTNLNVSVWKRNGRKDLSPKERETLPLFTQAAIDAVEKWRYRPVTRDGEPVAAYHIIRLDFDWK